MASVGATPPPASAGAACADLCMRWLARGNRFNLAEAAIRVSQSVSVQVGMSGRLCGTHVQRPAIEPVWDSNLKFRIQIAGYVVGYVCGVRRLTCWRIRCFRSLTNPSLSASLINTTKTDRSIQLELVERRSGSLRVIALRAFADHFSASVGRSRARRTRSAVSR